MTRIAWLLLLGLAACKKAAAPAFDGSAAQAAYDQKQWDQCAELFARGSDSGAQYNAACCLALGGKHDAAFEALDRAIGKGYRDADHMNADEDLAGLRGDPRWAKANEAVAAKTAEWEKGLGQPALRKEILALVTEDQAARNAWISVGMKDHPEVAKRVQDIDTKSTARMKEIVKQYGWPGKSLVGEDGANGAWLLVQHADLDHDFQKQCLPLIEAATKTGEVKPQHYAYLYDRLATAEGKPQRYGTQFQNDGPFPIEDEAHVDERRKAVGLGTMAEYHEEMRRTYGPAK
jgi:hypothetical protein